MEIESQTAGSVFMVRPAGFGFNRQTAATNAFQVHEKNAGEAGLQRQAAAEFDRLARDLSDSGVQVLIGADTAVPAKPDAVFPNNWVSFHADGTVVLYPMLAANRRLERREELLMQIRREGGFHVSRTIDLTHHEARGQFLEGTGSMVLDRTSRFAYACSSPRTHLEPLGEFARLLDYRVVSFAAFGADGTPVYHTNVMMSVGIRFAVVCAASIRDAAARAAVMDLLGGSHTLIELSLQQMQCFAGNLLELRSARGPVIAVSASAWSSLDPMQRRQLESFGGILPAAIPTIERAGGGSVRCMLAEIHLPRAAAPVA